MNERIKMIEEVKEIMVNNYDDFYAEEYDSRFDYSKYNDAIKKLNTIFCNFTLEDEEIGFAVFKYENSDLFITSDFSEICALVTKKLV